MSSSFDQFELNLVKITNNNACFKRDFQNVLINHFICCQVSNVAHGPLFSNLSPKELFDVVYVYNVITGNWYLSHCIFVNILLVFNGKLVFSFSL